LEAKSGEFGENMTRRDFALSVVAAYLIGLFLLPTLVNTQFFGKIPFPYITLYLVFPAFVIIGMFIASKIAKKIKVLWQVAKFGLVGDLNTAIDFGILNLLIYLTNYTQGTGIGLINTPSFTAAILNSYFWNRKWVFEGAKQGNFFVFVGITVIGLLINTSVVVIITTWIPPAFGLSPTLWANVAKVFATGFSMVWNFTGWLLRVIPKSNGEQNMLKIIAHIKSR